MENFLKINQQNESNPYVLTIIEYANGSSPPLKKYSFSFVFIKISSIRCSLIAFRLLAFLQMLFFLQNLFHFESKNGNVTSSIRKIYEQHISFRNDSFTMRHRNMIYYPMHSSTLSFFCNTYHSFSLSLSRFFVSFFLLVAVLFCVVVFYCSSPQME